MVPVAASPRLSWRVRSVLGARRDGLVPPPGTASPEGLFGPRGVFLGPGVTVVADTGNHRVAIWRGALADNAAADVILGQAGPYGEGRNRGGAASPGSMFVPASAVLVGGVLVVADSWNHRLLFWASLPTSDGAPAEWVWGQADGSSNCPNRGGEPTPNSLYWPYGLASDGRRLAVADTGNRRVLVFDSIPQGPECEPDVVLGQPNRKSGADNAAGAPSAASFRWPHGLATDGRVLLVADAGNHRVLEWGTFPAADGEPASLAIGQPDLVSTGENGGGRVGPNVLRFPYGVALARSGPVVLDTVNHRALSLDRERQVVGCFGQTDLWSAGENRWRPVERDSLCWPYGAHGGADGSLAIADTGNNRVLLMEVET